MNTLNRQNLNKILFLQSKPHRISPPFPLKYFWLWVNSSNPLLQDNPWQDRDNFDLEMNKVTIQSIHHHQLRYFFMLLDDPVDSF